MDRLWGGLLLCVLLTVFSPTVTGSSFALWPGTLLDWYKLRTPVPVSLPAAFFLGWFGSVRSAGASETDPLEVEYRILTGEGSRNS